VDAAITLDHKTPGDRSVINLNASPTLLIRKIRQKSGRTTNICDCILLEPVRGLADQGSGNLNAVAEPVVVV
jgi:hypothetical protein